jgi:hypothetical protein
MKKEIPPVNTKDDNEMVSQGLRQPLVKKATFEKTNSDRAMIKHYKALHKRGRVENAGPLFLNKV